MCIMEVKNMEKRKIVCLLSGGIDSSTLVAFYDTLGFDVYAITVYYGQRHFKELQSAKAIANYYNIHHTIINISDVRELISKSALTGDIEVPEGHYTDESQKQTVVPNRNMILLSIAAGYAITLDAPYIAYAAHYSDYAIYPDCRPEFLKPLQDALYNGNYDEVKILTPFLYLTKGEIVRLGLKLGVPYELTWSCYKGGEKACGKCGTCQERIEAFKFAGAKDPIEYEIEIDWGDIGE